MSDLATRVTEELQERLDRVPIPAAPVEGVRRKAARQRRRTRMGALALAAATVVAVGVGGRAVTGRQQEEPVAGQVLRLLDCVHVEKVGVVGPKGPDGTRTPLGTSKQICTHHGHTVIVWTLHQGPNLIRPSTRMRTIVTDLPGHVYVGCSRPADCVRVQQTFGGHLQDASSLLGMSITVA
jgi:hypothetical protein